MKLTGENRRIRGKTCPSASLSTTNPTWTDPGSNTGLRGERPAPNRLNHGTAFDDVGIKKNVCNDSMEIYCMFLDRKLRR
jgi:hypothetical protein